MPRSREAAEHDAERRDGKPQVLALAPPQCVDPAVQQRGAHRHHAECERHDGGAAHGETSRAGVFLERRGRQLHGEAGALRGGLDVDASAVAGHELVRHRETELGAAQVRARRREGIEQVRQRFLLDAGPVVLHAQHHETLAEARLDSHRVAFGLILGQRVQRIHDEVQHHLSEQPLLAAYRRHRIELGRDAGAPARLGLHDRQDRRHDLTQVHRALGRLGAAREPQQLGHHAPHALHPVARLAQHFVEAGHVRGAPAPGEMVEIARCEGDRVVDLVREARRERADRRHARAVRELEVLLAQQARALLDLDLESLRARLDTRGGRHEAAHQQPGEEEGEAAEAERHAVEGRQPAEEGQDVRQGAERPERPARRPVGARPRCDRGCSGSDARALRTAAGTARRRRPRAA